MGRAQARARDRQGRPPGRWRRGRHLWRDLGARHRGVDEGAEARHRLPAAHGELPGAHLRRRPHPGRLLQARGPSLREGDPGLPPDRPADPPPLRRGLAQRHPGRGHGALARPRDRSRHPRHGGGLRGADPLGRAVHGPDRRRPRRLCRRPVQAQPAHPGDGGLDPRPRRRRHPGRRADGRVRGEGTARGRDARGRDVRPQALPAGHRGDHPARREGRQGAAQLPARG